MAVTRHRLVSMVLLACLGALATVLLPAASAGTSAADYAARMVALVNQQRAAHGLVRVTAAQGTSEVADGWAAHLMGQQALSHNPDLRAQLESHGSADWHTYGEAVGRGPADDPDAVFAGYMQSAEHRSVILDPAMRFIGVGVRDDGPAAWNVLDFVDTYGATAASSAPASSAPAAATAPAHAQAAPPAAAPARSGTPAPKPAAAAPPPSLAITAVGLPVRQSASSPGLRGWVTAVPLQHHNRALPVALLAAGPTADQAVLSLIGPLPSSAARPAVPVAVAAALVGIVAVGLLVVVVGAAGGAAGAGRLLSARGSRSRVASRDR